ncbi:DUF541 domain-containing protein [Gimesia benthica]|uniref:DUF541 domain-containing protein n=2 Tax=Gimesia benthica TaxID=2608982 RepID=A0A6I6ADW6_9PLAN|nr:DUF541 domain-containing protein [Gimesia benthica]
MSSENEIGNRFMYSNAPEMSSGIKVYGSAVLHAVPDTASITAGITRIESEPKEAFAAARTGAQAVRQYLKTCEISEVGTSRINLEEEWRHEGGIPRFIGYQAKLSYNIIVREIDRLEEIIVGLMDAGANKLGSVSFETTRLKELRREARIRAVQAARSKAEVYASAAGLNVGEVVAIEDVNPDILENGSSMHVRRVLNIEDAGDVGAVDPGAISVGAAVYILFHLQP